jgi:ribonuclease P/MRP protein subunit POP5
MVRVKFRYLVVNFLYPEPTSKQRPPLPDLMQIHSPTPDAFNAGALIRLLRDAVEDLYGDYGSGMVSSSLKGTSSGPDCVFVASADTTQSTTFPPPLRPQ